MSNELYHYGILGMKWGVRRYQNADGSLTAAGKKRYSSSKDQPHYNVNAKDIKRNMDKMTDQELQRSINRLNMQQQVDRLNPNIIERGKRRAQRYIATVGLAVGVVAATKKLANLF